jgi:hypothetical protein
VLWKRAPPAELRTASRRVGRLRLDVVLSLKPEMLTDRLLLCRVNSTRDVHHGSTGHPSIEPGYFRVGDTPKRFFDRADLLKLFAHGWHVVTLEEHTIDRYERPKVIWELVALAS